MSASTPAEAGSPTPAPVDLEAIEEKWLRQCGACDAGMSMSCVCAEGDPRNVIANLVDEVNRYGKKISELAVENARLRERAAASEERRKSDNEFNDTVATGLRRERDATKAALAEALRSGAALRAERDAATEARDHLAGEVAVARHALGDLAMRGGSASYLTVQIDMQAVRLREALVAIATPARPVGAERLGPCLAEIADGMEDKATYLGDAGRPLVYYAHRIRELVAGDHYSCADEHLQALRDKVDDQRVALDLARRHIVEARAEIEYRKAAEAEARQEAERLRGEVQQRADDLAVLKPLAEDVDRRAQALIGEVDKIADNLSSAYSCYFGCHTATHANANRLRALTAKPAGSSDTEEKSDV